MAPSAIQIPPRRSLLLFALLAVFMVLLSYVFIVVLAAACVYLPFLLLINVQNFTTIMVFLGGIVIAPLLLWSLVPRRDKFVAPGLLLDPATYPQLFLEIRNIATALNEPPPSEVYLIGEPNAWVADRGGLMGFGSRRVMALGLPLVAVVNVSQFRAILAHEFAHYYGGDTSLGPWLHRTQMAMIRTFQNLGSIGELQLPNAVLALYAAVFGILKGYWHVFLRAINFVSRRQEFRADELACIVAGPASLTGGLRVLHASVLAWPSYWKNELAPMLNSGCLPSIAGGFSSFMTAPAVARDVEAGIEKDLREAKTEPYDSHPPLRDRLEAAGKLSTVSPPEDPQPASTLLQDIGETELKFLTAMNPDLSANSLRRVSWEESGSRFLIPLWVHTVSEYPSLVEGLTVGMLPQTKERLLDIASQMRDPKGMLLTPGQRVPYAVHLLASALALALVNSGWVVHASPGEFYVERDGKQMQPFEQLFQLYQGQVTEDSWLAMCNDSGVTDLQLTYVPKGEDTPRP